MPGIVCRVAIALFITTGAAVPAPAGSRHRAPVMSGVAELTLRVGTGFAPMSYTNRSFDQSLDGQTLTVRVDVTTATWSRTPFRLPTATTGGDDISRFARRAVDGAKTRVEAVNRLIHAVAGRVQYDASEGVPSVPDEVLRTGAAHCVGLSNLAVAGLDRIGIPSRVARGLLIDRESGRATPHRWIEVFYPDVGWVFSDPTESINFVSPLHVVLTPPGEPDPDYDPADVAFGQLRVERLSEAILAVDLRPQRQSNLAERRMVSAQFSATVMGRSDAIGTITLNGRGELRTAAVTPDRPFSFPGLEPGRYLLKGKFAEGERRVWVSVAAAQLVNVSVEVP